MENVFGLLLLFLTSLLQGVSSGSLNPNAINDAEFLRPTIGLTRCVLVAHDDCHLSIRGSDRLTGEHHFFASLKHAPTQGQGARADGDFDISRDARASIHQLEFSTTNAFWGAEVQDGQHTLFHDRYGFARSPSGEGCDNSSNTGNDQAEPCHYRQDSGGPEVLSTDVIGEPSSRNSISLDVKLLGIIACFLMLSGPIIGPGLTTIAIMRRRALFTRHWTYDALIGICYTCAGSIGFSYLAFW